MLPKIIVPLAALSVSLCAAQQPSASQEKPEVKVHTLNVCTPSAEEQQEIASALAHIPKRPSFSQDFEIDRGRSVLDQNASPLAIANTAEPSGESTVADFVRLRRDLTGNSAYSNVQYSFSRDNKQMVETLVFRVRDPKDLLQVSIEDSASSVTAASAMLGAATPANRIKLERFGKSSVVLARCSGTSDSPAPDQSKYEPLFASASAVVSEYRRMFGAKTLVPEELTRISRTASPAAKPQKHSNATTHK